MKRNFLILSIIVIACTSCSTYQYTSRNTAIETKNIVMSPTVVDVKADYTKRIVVTSRRCKTQQEAMQEARYLAVTQNQIDVVVDPIYKVERRSRRYQVTLTGFAGYFVNSRTLYEDVKLLHEIDREDIEKYLILHQPEVLQYMYDDKSEVININHYEDKGKSAQK